MPVLAPVLPFALLVVPPVVEVVFPFDEVSSVDENKESSSVAEKEESEKQDDATASPSEKEEE